MRTTVIAPNAWAASCLRFDYAKVGAVARKVMPIEYAVARLAGGFLQPIDRISALDAVRHVLETDCPAEFEAAEDTPGLAGAVTSSLMKAWSAGIDLDSLKGKHPRIAAMAQIEAAVMKALPPTMLRPRDLAARALARMVHAPSIFGRVTIVGRTEMSPVWREVVLRLTGFLPIAWFAGPRSVPDWLSGGIGITREEPANAPVEYVSCADGPQEVLAALRWARGLVASGKAKPEEIAICAAAPQAYDSAMSALSAAGTMPIHFVHGRMTVEGREGQAAAALADVFLNGLTLQGVRRIASLGNGPAWKALPDGWQKILPREASLSSLQRWSALLETVTDWPGGVPFKSHLIEILTLLSGDPDTAPKVGAALLGPQALAIWRRGLLEGPAEALLTSLAGLATPDDVEGLTSVVWGPASAIASYPRPYVWMMGLASGSWPRGIAEDPLLPGHVIDQALLNPLPVADADRRDFETIIRTATGGIMVSRSRRDVEGRLLGISSLWPLDAKVREIAKSDAPGCPISEGDRLAARTAEFKATPDGAASLEVWKNWHIDPVTAHDGKVRAKHPLVLAGLGRPMSASSIQLMLTNPIGWMFSEVLSMSEPEIESEPFELDHRNFGLLVHGIIEQAMAILAAGGGLAGANDLEITAAVTAAAAKVAGIMEIDVPVPPARLWRLTIERAVTMAVMALKPDFLTPLPGQQSWAEIPFGRVGSVPIPGAPWDTSKVVKIGDVTVRGTVDRLDLSGDKKKGRVVDWKTGRVPDDIGDRVIAGGSDVQRPIYASALTQLLGVTDVEAGLAYLKGGAHWAPVPDAKAVMTHLEQRLMAMREAIARGFLVPGIAADDKYSEFTFALPGDAKERYLQEKMPAIRTALGAAADVWEDK